MPHQTRVRGCAESGLQSRNKGAEQIQYIICQAAHKGDQENLFTQPLMRHATDRFVLRWSCGDDLNRPLPEHFCLTGISSLPGQEVSKHETAPRVFLMHFQRKGDILHSRCDITSGKSLDIRVTANWLLKAAASAKCREISETRTHLRSTIRQSLLWPFVSAVLGEWQHFIPH